jgi:MinD-like ATPase involved in chromosome partitioning or flagellar assembly
VVVGGDTGDPIVVKDPSSPAAQAFQALARQIVQQIESGHVGHTHAPHEHAHA